MCRNEYVYETEKVFELFYPRVSFALIKITERCMYIYHPPLTRHIEQTPHCWLKSYVPICTTGYWGTISIKATQNKKKINASHINKLSLNVFRFYCFVFSTRITSWSIRFDDGVIKFKPTVELVYVCVDLSSHLL